MSDTIYFYKDRPIFGLDLGVSGVKVMQLEKGKTTYDVIGYGFTSFAENCIQQGVIHDYESIAKAVRDMFDTSLVGKINTNRVAISVPAAFTFSRIISLPKNIQPKDIPEAVMTEVQQYLPSSASDLYIDYSIIGTQKDEHRVLTVAVSRRIVDSYMKLAQILGLEVVAMEPTTGASNRLFGYTDKHKVPSVLIDLGALSTDITIYDDDLVVTGTVTGGGEQYTQAIKNALGVTDQEAHTIKTRYGLNVSKKQTQIRDAVKPFIDEIVKEVKRMVRYYEERVNEKNQKIGQVVTLGGGANIPGLSDYLTDVLRLPVRQYDPWSTISFGKLQTPPAGEEAIYISAAGLGLISPEEPFV